jgi:GNAT superfamily N-acetyltransferase
MLITPRTDGIIPVRYLIHALDMRRVRNAVRQYMTGNRHEIYAHEQCDWYVNTYKPRQAMGEMFGFVYYKQRRPIGYGLITWREEYRGERRKFWLSGGIVPEEQGHGYGRELFEFLAGFLKSGEVWLDVFSSNEKAVKLYKALGFEERWRPGPDIIVMSRKVVAR